MDRRTRYSRAQKLVQGWIAEDQKENAEMMTGTGLRRTGRTTEMLKRALSTASRGFNVIVTVPDDSFRPFMAENLLGVARDEVVSIRSNRSKTTKPFHYTVAKGGELTIMAFPNVAKLNVSDHRVFIEHTVFDNAIARIQGAYRDHTEPATEGVIDFGLLRLLGGGN